jgi:CRISPR/Cas system-associated exonuclease Cas4 (RecB family)
MNTDKVICSAGKGVLSKTECLDCSLGGNNPCGYDYVLLKSIFASDQSADRRNEIHVTDLTGCIARAFYDKVHPTPEHVHEKLTKWLGTSLHAIVEGKDEKVISEMKLEWGNLVGKADAYYNDGRLIDIKTTRWLVKSKLPYGSHALQVNIYAYLLRKMGKPVTCLQIQYIDASGPTKCRKCKLPVRWLEGTLACPSCGQYIAGAHLGALLLEIPLMTDEEVEDQILERKSALEAAISTQLAPPKEPGYLCAYCAHMDICKPQALEGEEANEQVRY